MTGMNNVEIMWCGEYLQDWENEPHEHEFFQMVIVTGGKAKATVSGTEQTLEAGKLLLLRPGCQHGIHSEEAFHVYDAKFQVQDSQMRKQLMNMPSVLEMENFQRIKVYFQRILKESEDRKPYYKQMSACYFWIILVELLRPKTKEQEPEVTTEAENQAVYKNVEIWKVERFIRDNYAGQITLDTLMDVANCNKTTLIQVFKEIYGKTPFSYIIQVRLQKAKDLLVNTDISVSEISNMTGFQSVHYFSRFFKEREGYSPLEYRVKYSKNRFYTF